MDLTPVNVRMDGWENIVKQVPVNHTNQTGNSNIYLTLNSISGYIDHIQFLLMEAHFLNLQIKMNVKILNCVRTMELVRITMDLTPAVVLLDGRISTVKKVLVICFSISSFSHT